MKADRIVWVDQLRGFAILLVIIGHLIQFNQLGVDNPVFEIIYSFHMPLFFAISGYIAERTSRIENLSGYILFAKKKLISIGLPWLVWGLIVNGIAFTDEWPKFSLVGIISFMSSGGLWFLRDLLIIMLIFGVHKLAYSKVQSRKLLSFLAPFTATLLLVGLLIIFKLVQVNMLLWTFSFYFGVLLMRYDGIWRLCQNKHIATLSLIVFVCLAGHWNFNGTTVDDVLKFVCSSSAIVALFFFFASHNSLLGNKMSNKLEVFGKNSLSIYVLQFYFCHLTPPEFCGEQLKTLFFNNLFLLAVCSVIAIGIASVCVWIANSIKSFPVLSLILLGNHKKDINEN